MAQVDQNITIDVIIPSIRLDPTELLSRLGIDIPDNVTAYWYIIIDSDSMKSTTLTYKNSQVKVIVNDDNLGAPLSRNVGLDIGTSKYVLFLDDDIVSKPDIIHQYVKAIHDNPDAVGYIGPTQFPDPINSFTRGIGASDMLTFFELPKNREWMPWGTTSNIMIRRECIGDVRFSQIFPKHGGGEDVDFCLNVGSGKLFKTVSSTLVNHGWWGNGRRSYRRFFRWAYGDSKLHKRYPQFQYYDLPNTIEMFILGTPIIVILHVFGLSLESVLVYLGSVASGEIISEYTRVKMSRRGHSFVDALESSLIRLSNMLGRFLGLISDKNFKAFLRRFDFITTGEWVVLERKLSVLRFASCLVPFLSFVILTH